MNQFTSGIFYDALTANKAVNAILAMDYPRDRINVILSSQTRRRFWDDAASEQQTSRATKSGSSDDIIGSLLASGASGGPAKRSSTASDDAEAVIVVGPTVSSPVPGRADARGSNGAFDVLTRLGLSPADAERLYREIVSGAIVVGVSTNNGDRAGVERAMRENATRNVMETATRR